MGREGKTPPFAYHSLAKDRPIWNFHSKCPLINVSTHLLKVNFLNLQGTVKPIRSLFVETSFRIRKNQPVKLPPQNRMRTKSRWRFQKVFWREPKLRWATKKKKRRDMSGNFKFVTEHTFWNASSYRGNPKFQFSNTGFNSVPDDSIEYLVDTNSKYVGWSQMQS